MSIKRSAFVLGLTLCLSISVLADTQQVVTSPEVVVKRIHAKRFDWTIGIGYKQGDSSSSGDTSPIFFPTRHKVKPQEGTRALVGVEVPANATIVSVQALMKNEPWGGLHRPPKANTDDLGSTDYRDCPMGRGDCSIAWADAQPYSDALDATGRRLITTVFRNWAGRNDRTAKLQVTYTVPD